MSAPGERRRLPLGIQTFRKIREDGCYYVDKTEFARQLVDGGTHYFLSRPRRFGKSLFVDTLKELFEGNEPLFRGLAIHDRWDWSVRHPVVRLDFSGGAYRSLADLRASLTARLLNIERAHGITPVHTTAPERLAYLIAALRERSGQRVAVLVDEYDKPILEVLDEPEAARANRDFLRGVYGAVKYADADIRFSLFTGVSKFTKVSLFSDLNNLTDITLRPEYSSICGYSEEDLDTVFGPELPGLDRDRVRDWYNGYRWLGDERVYNPYGILLLFDTRKFRAHWFETGSPAFLIETLTERGLGPLDLEAMQGEEALLGRFDVGNIGTEALLFQTGYLTITGENEAGGRTRYGLGYPNREVKQSLNTEMLGALGLDPSRRTAREVELEEALAAADFGKLERLFRAVFAGVPYEWHTRNAIARYEGYYASVVYALFAAIAADVRVEDSSNRNRVDLAVRAYGQVFLLEFKVVEREAEGRALTQLRERGYAEKYRGRGEPIHLVGVEFSRAERNLVSFAVERA